MSVYTGLIEVEDGDFELEANRLIIRGSDIAFELSGSDEYGSFNIQGVAEKTKHGFHMAPKLNLNYPQYVSEDTASIKFNEIDTETKKGKCNIKGSWLQAGDSWKIFGTLNEYKA